MSPGCRCAGLPSPVKPVGAIATAYGLLSPFCGSTVLDKVAMVLSAPMFAALLPPELFPPPPPPPPQPESATASATDATRTVGARWGNQLRAARGCRAGKLFANADVGGTGHSVLCIGSSPGDRLLVGSATVGAPNSQ